LIKKGEKVNNENEGGGREERGRGGVNKMNEKKNWRRIRGRRKMERGRKVKE
jgi:hypothetical protein